MKRKTREVASSFLAGLAMGTSDLIPGVSGGTVALIVGVYQRLIGSIASLTSPVTLRLLRSGSWGGAWKQINGGFLLALGLGMVTAIFGFASVVAWLLERHAVATNAVFLGLIARAAWHVAREADNGVWSTRLMLLPGAAVALTVVLQPSVTLGVNPVSFVVGGALASSAMLLPGVSGAFVLLILGLYAPVVDAVASLQLTVLVPVAFGILMGALTVARVMGGVFRRYPSSTSMTLAGFMLGSLPAVWPFAPASLTATSVPVWALTLLVVVGMGAVVALEQTRRTP
jgi:putative membrane protein